VPSSFIIYYYYYYCRRLYSYKVKCHYILLMLFIYLFVVKAVFRRLTTDILVIIIFTRLLCIVLDKNELK